MRSNCDRNKTIKQEVRNLIPKEVETILNFFFGHKAVAKVLNDMTMYGQWS